MCAVPVCRTCVLILCAVHLTVLDPILQYSSAESEAPDGDREGRREARFAHRKHSHPGLELSGRRSRA